ncbi:hypothetical protein FM076_17385 [Streptomyces albus subsp. chlorinus]|uniref:hypothetical protein n=1 Tax=Streptomyces albus TaxID=1888 RepID=UPI001570AA5C|nr:hypothetical protein [Streptomyces albus]NSC22847.1 hypothetical protein [Streptomyces albus subsp. chlorinus]
MTNPHTAPIPPVPSPPASRPLRRRILVWVGGSALFIAGLAIGSTGDGGQQAAEYKAEPAQTVTATTTATTKPKPAVTKTVEAKKKPGFTVTATKTVTAPAVDAGSGNSDRNSVGDCTIVSNSGNCYSAGQFCRNSDHGATTSTESGRKIKCAFSSNAWRWTYT